MYFFNFWQVCAEAFSHNFHMNKCSKKSLSSFWGNFPPIGSLADGTSGLLGLVRLGWRLCNSLIVKGYGTSRPAITLRDFVALRAPTSLPACGGALQRAMSVCGKVHYILKIVLQMFGYIQKFVTFLSHK